MNIKEIYQKVRDGETLFREDVLPIVEAGEQELPEVFMYAARLKEEHFGKDVAFCAIFNAKSGKCPENCAFCAQSAHAASEPPVHPFVEPGRILEAAGKAKANGVPRFAIVTSGMRLTPGEFEVLLSLVRDVRAMGLCPDISVGFLEREQLRCLKEAGLCAVHHNLETARSFFPQICSTHDYEDDVRTVRAAVQEGLYVCSGGIFGLGENWDHRIELALTLRELGVPSVPVNFLNPIPGTRLEGRLPLSPEEALKIVALYRFLLPEKHIRICGGRELVFGQKLDRLLFSGASGVMVGDYLTTQGTGASSVRSLVESLGLEVRETDLG